MLKVLTIVGARPQFIKAAVVSRAIHKHGEIEELIVHTGQHYDHNMSEVFFKEMDIPHPDINLDIQGLTHGAMTGRMLEGIENVLLDHQPDYVLVYGDTNSTLAGALAASKQGIKLAHVEAGLRSFNMAMPEEINRILTDRISDLLFCPTEVAKNNLMDEGFSQFGAQIEVVGDVMYDAARFYEKSAAAKSTILDRLKPSPGDFVLVTMHRQENTDDLGRLKSIVAALNALSKDHQMVMPIHPRTRKVLQREQLSFDFATIDPVGYFDMIQLLSHCALVMTDSGGLQKEAYFFEKPCLTLRDQTEWVELVTLGVNKLVGAHQPTIQSSFEEMHGKQLDFSAKPYGDGDAGMRIVNKLWELS